MAGLRASAGVSRRSLLVIAGVAAGTAATGIKASAAMAAAGGGNGYHDAGLPDGRTLGGTWTDSPQGFAGISSHGLDTTTGGSGGQVVRASSPALLREYARSPEPLVIVIDGVLTFSQYEKLQVTSNKSFLGSGRGATVVNAGFKLINVKNVVFRNFTIRDSYIPGDFVGKRPDNDRDGIQMDTSHHIWVDHMFFTRLGDGLVDVRKDCDNVTLSWNVFADHNKALGQGWSQNVVTRISVHHNWIRNTHQRNASLDNTAASHVYNNYLENISSYGMLGRNAALLLVENNYFRDVRNPLNHQGPGGELISRGNIFAQCSGNTGQDRGSSFIPPYPYDTAPASAVPALVPAFAGPLGGTVVRPADTITVALDGTGDYASIRAAIGAIPSNSPGPVTVLIQPGTYHEPAVLWGDRRNVTLAGATGQASDIVLTHSAGVTLEVAADGSSVRDITVTSDVLQGGPVLRASGRNITIDNVEVLNGTSE